MLLYSKINTLTGSMLALMALVIGCGNAAGNATSDQNCEQMQCPEHSHCRNVGSEVRCVCDDGYSQFNQTCVDVNECDQNIAGCDPNANCVNQDGSFACVCKSGFTGDGKVCIDVNECLSANGGCDVNATCVNTTGSYHCECKTGFVGNGLTCARVDPCSDNNGGCDGNADCEDDTGTVVCRCKPGYQGDGQDCQEVAVVLNGLRWEMPCDELVPEFGCTPKSGTMSEQATLSGEPDQLYSITLRFRGVVEQMSYAGGSQDGLWYVGGVANDANYNVYKLHISDPDQTFYLNAGQAGLSYCQGLDYSKDLQMKAGAVVTLSADAQDDMLVINQDQSGNPIVVLEVAPFPLSFNGQFIQMDVISVAIATP
jgi:hypothetical protein